MARRVQFGTGERKPELPNWVYDLVSTIDHCQVVHGGNHPDCIEMALDDIVPEWAQREAVVISNYKDAAGIGQSYTDEQVDEMQAKSQRAAWGKDD